MHECHKAIVVITGRAHCFHNIYYAHLDSVRFEHCVWWITYDQLYTAYLACGALFGSLVPAMWNHKSCVQVHEFPQSLCGDYYKHMKMKYQIFL